MENNEEIPEIETKSINGVEITNLEYAKIAMICDYLILDRFQNHCSFFRLEKCFGPLFMKESHEFLTDVFKEICGPRHKYISFPRLILAYTKWKSNSSKNENFNKFMNIVFNEIIITKEQKIGELKEGGRIFSTRNSRGRKVISRFSVLTDESKNKLRGFHIQYDDVFDNILSPLKTKESITLEMNFPPIGRDIRDRDGISHIGGKYSNTKGCIKFLIFKCRSGKTFYIGDEKEEKGENIKYFLFGTSSCQLKSIRVELINEQLIYFEPKFQPSLRINQKIVDFDSIDEKYINENIMNEQLIFEENEIQSIPLEQLEENNGLIIPCINDDAFLEKGSLDEPLSGKDFNEIYKTLLVQQGEIMEKEKEDLKSKIYEKTIMRKHLLRVYLKKFKVKENISVLKSNTLSKSKISQDKFLVKIPYREKMDKKIEEKKEEKKEDEDKKEEKKDEEENYWDNEEEKDWPQDDAIEIKEVKEDVKEEVDKKEDLKEDKKEDIKEDKKEEIKNEIPIEENNTKNDDNKDEEKEPLDQPKLRGKPRKILRNKIGAIKKLREKEELEKKKQEEEQNNQEDKKEEPKKEEIKIEEPKIEIKTEEPKKEEIKIEEPKIDIKTEEPKKLESKKKENKIPGPKNEIIIGEKDDNQLNLTETDNIINNKTDNNINESSSNIKNNTSSNQNKKDNETVPTKKRCWCNIF